MQFPCPGAPLNRVHCEIATADPRIDVAVRSLKIIFEASMKFKRVNLGLAVTVVAVVGG